MNKKILIPILVIFLLACSFLVSAEEKKYFEGDFEQESTDSQASNSGTFYSGSILESILDFFTGRNSETSSIKKEIILKDTGSGESETLKLTGEKSGDPVFDDSRVIEAQKILNVNGFNSKSQIAGISDGTFSDYVNPITGALTITQTDAIISGRNGIKVPITRSYSSNIFLNINRGSNGLDCNSIKGYNTGRSVNIIDASSCVDCYPVGGFLVGGFVYGVCGTDGTNCRDMDGCEQQGEGDSSSFVRAKYLGRGWSLNQMENKIKDPTQLIFQNFFAAEPNDPTPTTTYRYVSARGINSISKNGEQLIMPSMYAKISDLILPEENINFFSDLGWNYDTGFGWPLTTETEYQNFMNDKQWSYRIFNSPLFKSKPDVLAYLQNYFTGNTAGGEEPGDFRPGFVGYTSDMTQVKLLYDVSTDYTSVVPFGATVRARDGTEYSYGNYVKFCDKYDDVAPTGLGDCDDGFFDQTGCWGNGCINDPTSATVLNWAENPYAGLYLTEITDAYGNRIIYDYIQDLSSGINTPFINQIYTPGAGDITFNYDAISESERNINTRINKITVPSGSIDSQYNIIYTYTNDWGQGQLNYEYTSLLTSTCLEENGGFECIPGTKYEYDYDQYSQELIYVKLPTGAEIHYEYEWSDDFPSFDYVRQGFLSSDEVKKMPRRVVTKRTIVGGGICPGSQTSCSWTYDYGFNWDPDGDGNEDTPFIIETTVTDPMGNKVITEAYSAVYTTISYSGDL